MSSAWVREAEARYRPAKKHNTTPARKRDVFFIYTDPKRSVRMDAAASNLCKVLFNALARGGHDVENTSFFYNQKEK
jgi:hypothetical protein